MSKVEDYIKEYTRNCSNVLVSVQSKAGEEVISYNPWLTPYDAKKVAEIAREEVMKSVGDILLKRLASRVDYHYGSSFLVNRDRDELIRLVIKDMEESV